MLMIRFQRIGRTNDAAFRIVVLEKERAAKSGSILAQVGTYNPRTKAFTLDAETVKEWIGKGAQLTPSLHNLLLEKKVIEGKKINVVAPSAIIKEVVAEEVVATPAAPAAAAPALEVVEAPAEEAAPAPVPAA